MQTIVTWGKIDVKRRQGSDSTLFCTREADRGTSAVMKPTSVVEGLDLEGIVRAHQAELWRYLRFLGCEATLVDDLIQETFLSLLQKPFEDRGPATTAAYLRRVARNHYLMALRKSARVVIRSKQSQCAGLRARVRSEYAYRYTA